MYIHQGGGHVIDPEYVGRYSKEMKANKVTFGASDTDR